jgi:hypothetical protein
VTEREIPYPDGIIENSTLEFFEGWFSSFCQFGQELEKVARLDNGLKKNFVLIVPRREYVATAISFGFICGYLGQELHRLNQNDEILLSDLKPGMTISGYRVPLRPNLGDGELEFLATVYDVSKITSEVSPRIGLEVKGIKREWHAHSLKNLRIVNINESSRDKIGFYAEETEYGQLPWKWLLEERGKNLRSFQDPIINIRGGRNALEEEWSKRFFWRDGEKNLSAPIERLLCPLKVGVPGPFFIDASLVEKQNAAKPKSLSYGIQILNSVNSIKNNFEFPASNLLLTILAKNENATKNLVPSIEGRISNSFPLEIELSSIHGIDGIELVMFGDQ